jgi:hypothetical protein
MQRNIQLEPFLDEGDEHIDGDGDLSKMSWRRWQGGKFGG